ncbi:GEM-like protein 5 [Hibiscus syriacus]|uniref:GEM-like protein 5 n=1 Tax=Hibiscus syriacus TaxID=106335 RepID=A0A6A2Z3N5_HIBSY|nr:GEM-like protein 5 [Hibiscus syriacus]
MAATPEGNAKLEKVAHEQPKAAPPSEEETKKWGTHVMGAPAAPSSHPDNQRAALWNAGDHQQIYEIPYVVYSPAEKPSHNNPLESVINMFNTWSSKAESIARNNWHNLKTGPSVSEAAWGKLNLTVKAITEGGFESLFKQIFAADPNERLKKTFACYLSTTTVVVHFSIGSGDLELLQGDDTIGEYRESESSGDERK